MLSRSLNVELKELPIFQLEIHFSKKFLANCHQASKAISRKPGLNEQKLSDEEVA